jgi:hypothetical protein
MESFFSKPKLKDTINALRDRNKRLSDKLKGKRDEIILSDSLDQDKITEYQKMNEELRKTKIYEAELVYLRNML